MKIKIELNSEQQEKILCKILKRTHDNNEPSTWSRFEDRIEADIIQWACQRLHHYFTGEEIK